jgi:hypothetical protein
MVKQGLRTCGLWGPAYWLRSAGKGYRISEGDGLSYPYSVFDDLSLLRGACAHVNILSLRGGGPNLLSTASHVALLGVKKPKGQT